MPRSSRSWNATKPLSGRPQRARRFCLFRQLLNSNHFVILIYHPSAWPPVSETTLNLLSKCKQAIPLASNTLPTAHCGRGQARNSDKTFIHIVSPTILLLALLSRSIFFAILNTSSFFPQGTLSDLFGMSTSPSTFDSFQVRTLASQYEPLRNLAPSSSLLLAILAASTFFVLFADRTW